MSNLTHVAAQNSVVWFIRALAWPKKMQTNQSIFQFTIHNKKRVLA